MDRIGKYPSEALAEDEKSIINQFDVKAIFLQSIEMYSDDSENGEAFSESTMEEALLGAFHRMAYHLFYELRRNGQKFKMSHLLQLLKRLEDAFDFYVKSDSSFSDAVDWDLSLPVLFESISNLQTADSSLVGDDLIESLALQSITSRESEIAAKARIDQVISEVRARFAQAMPRADQSEIFDVLIQSHINNYSEYRNRVSDPETFFNGLFDEVENLCLTSFSSNQEVVGGEAKLKKLVKERFNKYNDLIDMYMIQIMQFLKIDYEIAVMPTVESIWDAIIRVVIEHYKNDLEDNAELVLPEIPAARKSGPMLS